MSSPIETQSTINLSEIALGFSDPVHESQACFRAALQAVSSPGSVIRVASIHNTPTGLHGPATALLLTLLDSDCSLWLSPSLRRREITAFFRFHTGCELVSDPGAAGFALVGDEIELPRLAEFNWGSDDYPDRSASLIVQVPELCAQGSWLLTGPGIEHQQTLRAGALPLWFVGDWEAARQSFPRGVDLFLSSASALAALPRTTRISLRT